MIEGKGQGGQSPQGKGCGRGGDSHLDIIGGRTQGGGNSVGGKSGSALISYEGGN